MKTRFRWLKNKGIRFRLTLAYTILILVPMCITGISHFITSRNTIYEVVRENVYEAVRKNNEIMDQKLRSIRSSCWSILTDRDFIEKSSQKVLNNNAQIIATDQELTRILDKYFVPAQEVCFVQLITSRFTFGYSTETATNRKFIPCETFMQSELYESAVKANGELVWFPSYDFSAWFQKKCRARVDPDNRYMFSALQVMKTSKIQFGGLTTADISSENPVLIISFSERLFQDIFKSSITMANSHFFVITSDGRFVSHQDRSKIGETADYPWLAYVAEKKSGQEVVRIDDRRMLICYDTSKETGWISVIAIDNQKLLENILASLRFNSIYILIAMTVIPILISMFVSATISKPITKLTRAIGKTGEGEFMAIPEEDNVEFDKLIRRFNSMNEKIRKLIQENYELKLREKDAEINALTLQLNPHFMYNTLNMINLKLLQSGQDEISDMVLSLSAMLKYTARNMETFVTLEQELDYLKGYILIMAKRFEGMFEVRYEIDPGMLGVGVPKFLLQPLVENAVIHGFESGKRRGLIHIRCAMKGDRHIFEVEDNGKGMTREKIDEILQGRTNSVGIVNIINRIRIIYGNDYSFNIQSEPEMGAKITIFLPERVMK